MAGRPRSRERRETGEWTPLPESSLYRCNGHSVQTGERCTRITVPGSPLCWEHGGESKLMDKRRSRWLLELYGKAMDTAAEVLDDEDPRIRIAASKLLTDAIDPKAEEETLMDTSGEEAMGAFLRKMVQIRKELGKPISDKFKKYDEDIALGPVQPAALPEGPSTRDVPTLEDLI